MVAHMESVIAVIPEPVRVVAVIVVLVLILRPLLRARRIVNPTKDPDRMFTGTIRKTGFARAGNRCEMETIPFVRCQREASHGDHFFPHANGGATNLDNFVAACPPCNLAKSDKMPSKGQARRMAARRRRYFTDPNMTLRPGSWYGR